MSEEDYNFLSFFAKFGVPPNNIEAQELLNSKDINGIQSFKEKHSWHLTFNKNWIKLNDSQNFQTSI